MRIAARALGPLALLACLGACRPGTIDDQTTQAEASTATPTSTSESSGAETSAATETETGEGVDLCDPDLYQPCWDAANAALNDCLDACACDDFSCIDACVPMFDVERWACTPDEVESMCSTVYNRAWHLCEVSCEAHTASCGTAGCDPNGCAYEEMLCINICGYCPGYAEFEFTYADSCELLLPGPPGIENEPYVQMEAGNMFYEVAPFETPCDNPDGLSVMWGDAEMSSLQLCPEACDAFAEAGALLVEYGNPPCD